MSHWAVCAGEDGRGPGGRGPEWDVQGQLLLLSEYPPPLLIFLCSVGLALRILSSSPPPPSVGPRCPPGDASRVSAEC